MENDYFSFRIPLPFFYIIHSVICRQKAGHRTAIAFSNSKIGSAMIWQTLNSWPSTICRVERQPSVKYTIQKFNQVYALCTIHTPFGFGCIQWCSSFWIFEILLEILKLKLQFTFYRLPFAHRRMETKKRRRSFQPSQNIYFDFRLWHVSQNETKYFCARKMKKGSLSKHKVKMSCHPHMVSSEPSVPRSVGL